MGIVKERMDGMVAIAKALKELTAISKTGSVDAQAVSTHAQTIAEHSGARLLALFPEGSLQNVSEARLTIWEDWDRFEALARQMEAQARDLPEMTTPDALQNALNATNQTCAACHKAFRLKK